MYILYRIKREPERLGVELMEFVAESEELGCIIDKLSAILKIIEKTYFEWVVYEELFDKCQLQIMKGYYISDIKYFTESFRLSLKS